LERQVIHHRHTRKYPELRTS